MVTTSGSVVLVSLGPGDPGLITVKGLRALEEADFIFFPFTRMPNGKQASRSLVILTELGVAKDKFQPFEVPMNKERSSTIDAYNKAASEIAEKYRLSQRVVIAAEGDSGFYSSVQFIGDCLSAICVPVSQIAGVPAFIAAGALANIHIAKQQEELDVVPGTISLDDLKERLAKGKTVVVMKLSQCEEVIRQALADCEDVCFHYFENIGVDEKEFYTCEKEQILARRFPYFSLMMIQCRLLKRG